MIIINIDVMLAKRKMSVTQLSEKVGLSMVNISILKNGRAKGLRFATLNKICEALDFRTVVFISPNNINASYAAHRRHLYCRAFLPPHQRTS